MKIFLDKNIIQDYGFLSCRNELLYLAIVLTYDSMEKCGIWINSTRALRHFTRLCLVKIYSLLVLLILNTIFFHAVISLNSTDQIFILPKKQ